jgi:hypothetical protein
MSEAVAGTVWPMERSPEEVALSRIWFSHINKAQFHLRECRVTGERARTWGKRSPISSE